MVLATYLLLGALAGVLAGLFGIGGGLVIVPVLVFTFSFLGMPAEILTHMAVATSLATIVVTSLSSIKTHHEKGVVDWLLFKQVAPWIAVGTVVGVFTAGLLQGYLLQKIIGVYALVVAVQMGFGLKPSPSRTLPGVAGLAGVGGFIGWVSAIFGIGGGSLSVPFFNWCNVRMQKAVATSAACGFPIAIFGAVTNVYQGWQHALLPEWSLGFVYLPAFIGIVVTSTYFAKVGAHLAHRLSADVLKRVFAVMLLLVGLQFLVGEQLRQAFIG